MTQAPIGTTTANASKEPFYITTAIDYLTGPPHLGHVYEKVLTDTLARYHRLAGYPVYFLTGTDEHGERIVKLAAQLGKTPQAFADDLSDHAFRALWDRLEIGYDDFIRTTESRHRHYVQEVLARVHAAGDIYYAEYEGLYSLGAERYVTEKELVGGIYPGDSAPPELRREANYFFRMEKYQAWLLEHLQANPDFIQPSGYRNEVLEMLKEPIGDLSISRPKSRVPWGIELPWDSDHVTYVWFDALLNYASAPASKGRSELFKHAWHVIGKDILKPHAVFWPTMLRAAGLPLYQKLVVHAHILAEDGRKMGKSLGNAIDPLALLAEYGPDTFRYTLLRETSLGADSPYGEGILVARLTADLANDLGNLLSRTLSMVQKYRAGVVPSPGAASARVRGIEGAARALPLRVLALARELKVNMALEAAMEFVRDLNRFIAESKPWELAKAEEHAGELDTVLYTAVEGLRVASVALEAAIPGKAQELRAQLGLSGQSYRLEPAWGLTPPGTPVQPGAVLFPKPEQLKPEAKTANQPKPGAERAEKDVKAQTSAPLLPSPPNDSPAAPDATPAPPQSQEISIDDFARIDLRVALVTAAEVVKGADKLLKLTVQLGSVSGASADSVAEERTVVSGIRQWFTPEQLVGRRVVVVANLRPVKLRGILSHGMILAAEDEHGNLDVIGPRLELPGGTKVR